MFYPSAHKIPRDGGTIYNARGNLARQVHTEIYLRAFTNVAETITIVSLVMVNSWYKDKDKDNNASITIPTYQKLNCWIACGIRI
jgi:hypothetical protein